MNPGRVLACVAAISLGRPLGHLSALTAQCPDGSAPPCRAARVDAGRKPGVVPNSVAVLYFDNLSRDTADAYLADGLTEELIARLGQVERLTVKSRFAVRRYRGASTDDPATVGRVLGVTHLVTGSVRRSGTRLRVTVELMRAAGGDREWGDQYDRTEADFLAVEEDVARRVATVLAGWLLPTEQARLSVRSAYNAAAYDHFLRGNYYLARRDPLSLRRAIEEYDVAVRLDPGFSPALARQASAYEQLFNRLAAGIGDSLLARGLDLAERALRQDSASSDAWMAIGHSLEWRHPRDFAGVIEASSRAVALDPRNAEARHELGVHLSMVGRDSAAAAEFRAELAEDPTRGVAYFQLAHLAHLARQEEEAECLLDSALADQPGSVDIYAQRAWVRLRVGKVEDARRDAETALRLASGADRRVARYGEAALVLVDLAAGDSSGARARAERLTSGPPDPVPTFWAGASAITLAAVGRPDDALGVLEQYPRGPRLWRILRRPEFDRLRSSPRFQRIVEESRPR